MRVREPSAFNVILIMRIFNVYLIRVLTIYIHTHTYTHEPYTEKSFRPFFSNTTCSCILYIKAINRFSINRH